MTSEPINLVLEHLRVIRADLAEVKQTLHDHGSRLSAIEIGIASLRREQGADAEAAARLNVRVDRMNRITRIERRLELLDDRPPEA